MPKPNSQSTIYNLSYTRSVTSRTHSLCHLFTVQASKVITHQRLLPCDTSLLELSHAAMNHTSVILSVLVQTCTFFLVPSRKASNLYSGAPLIYMYFLYIFNSGLIVCIQHFSLMLSYNKLWLRWFPSFINPNLSRGSTLTLFSDPPKYPFKKKQQQQRENF